jgi:1-acyl-sn-glycerol-3-phosphate acyltransferase
MHAVSDADLPPLGLPRWHSIRPADLWRWPLPELPSLTDRLLTRLVGLLALTGIAEIEGWERVHPRHDPFLLAANHSSRREALLLPAVVLLARGGRPVRFLADWNFRLIPGVGRLYDRGGAITLTRKPARPRILNRLKPRFESPITAFKQARAHLLRGGAVGIFPEGRVNRDVASLLPGRRGAARLSLELGVPVVPVGIRFAGRGAATGSVDPSSPLHLQFGEPMHPPAVSARPSHGLVTDWHAELMTAIAHLSGKHWPGPTGAKPRLHQLQQQFPPDERGGGLC